MLLGILSACLLGNMLPGKLGRGVTRGGEGTYRASEGGTRAGHNF